MESNDSQRLVVSVKEVKELLGLSRNAVYQAIARGEIPVVKVGRRLLVPKKALERFLEEGKSFTTMQRK